MQPYYNTWRGGGGWGVFTCCQVDINKDETLGIPIAYNPKSIDKHVQLVMLDDLSLVKLAKEMKLKTGS